MFLKGLLMMLTGRILNFVFGIPGVDSLIYQPTLSRNAGTPERRNAGTPERRNAGTPERRNAGTPERRIMSVLFAWHCCARLWFILCRSPFLPEAFRSRRTCTHPQVPVSFFDLGYAIAGRITRSRAGLVPGLLLVTGLIMGMAGAANAQSTPNLYILNPSETPVTEGGEAVFVVAAIPAPVSDLTVRLSVTDAAGSDFLASGEEGDKMVTIKGGEGSATYTVSTQADSTDEADGAVTVALAEDSSYTVSPVSDLASATVDITDDDATAVMVTVLDTSADKGDTSDTAAITLTLRNRGLVTGEELTVPLQFSGGTLGTAFTLALRGSPGGVTLDANTGEVTFTGGDPASARTATVLLTASDDDDGVSESVTVTIPASDTGSAPKLTATGLGGGATGSGSGVITLVDDEATVAITGPIAPVTEGGDAVFTVTADPAPTSDLTVSLSVAELGAPFGDFLASGDEGSQTVTISRGETTAEFTVAITEDTIDEAPSIVLVEVVPDLDYAVDERFNQSLLFVEDDDATGVTLTLQDPRALAGDASDTAAITLTLDRGLTPGEGLAVPLQFSGGTLGTDFTLALSGSPDGVTLDPATGVVTLTPDWPIAEPATNTRTTATEVTVLLTALEDDDAVFKIVTVTIPASDTGSAPVLGVTNLDGGAAGSGSGRITINYNEVPTVTIEAPDSPVTEGGEAVFTVMADPAPTSDLTVRLIVADAAGSDFLASGDEGGDKTVTITGGTTTATYTVSTQADDTDEPDGAVRVALAGDALYILPTMRASATASATADITDDDATAVTLSVPDTIADEGDTSNTAAITLTLNRALVSGETLTVPLQFSGATLGTEFMLALSGSPEGVTLTGNEVVFAPPTDTTDTFAPLPGEPSPQPQQPAAPEVTVLLTAVPDADAGSESVTVTIPASDTGSAPKLTAAGLGGGATGSGSGVITINDNEAPTVTIAGPGSVVTEGSDLVFTVTADPAPTNDLVVNLHVAEGAVIDYTYYEYGGFTEIDFTRGDFVAADDEGSQTVTIPGGQTAADFTVATVADDIDEPFGIVSVAVVPGPDYAVDGLEELNLRGARVEDDDAIRVTLSTPDTRALEGSTSNNTAAIKLTLNRGLVTDESLTVPLQFSGGTLGTDFTLALSGSPTRTGVTLDANTGVVTFGKPLVVVSATEVTVLLTALEDDDAVSERVTVTIPASDTGAGAVLTATGLGGGATGSGSGEITLVDDEAPAVPGISLSEDLLEVNEGGTATYTMVLDSAPTHDVTVTVTVPPTDSAAAITVDTAAGTPGNQNTLTFTPATWDRPQTVTVTGVEDDDSFGTLANLDLTHAVRSQDAAYHDIDIASVAVTVFDDDPVTPIISIAGPASPVTEGDDAVFTVTADPTPTRDLTVSLSVADAAASDFVASDDEGIRTVTISGGETTATYAVRTQADDTDEADGAVTVTLMEDSSYTVSPSAGSAMADITDDDAATVAVISISADRERVAEGADAAFTLARTGDVAAALLVRVEVSESGAVVARGDKGPREVTFAAGSGTAVLSVATVDDGADEPDSVVRVALMEDTATPARYGLGAASRAAVTVLAGDVSRLRDGRRAGAAALLRRHVQRFSQLTSDVALGRLEGGRGPSDVDVHVTNETRKGQAELSFGLRGGWEGWSSLRYSRLGGTADGEVWDAYFGADYRSGDGRSVYGMLLGYEPGRVTSEGVLLDARHVHLGFYGARRLSETLIFDGAVGWGRGWNDLSMAFGPEALTASYRSERLTARGDLTGDFGWGSGPLRVAPQIGLLYAEERLGAFTDSVGGAAEADELWLARVGFGPRLTWTLTDSVTHMRLRVNLDAHNLDQSGARREEVSAAFEAGHGWQIDERSSLDLSGSVDGLGSGWFSSGSLGVQYQRQIGRRGTLDLSGNLDGREAGEALSGSMGLKYHLDF